MDEKRATEATKVTQLYGVSDLAAALKVPHGYVPDGYVTPFLNRGIGSWALPNSGPTHQWRGFRLFTHERIEQIVKEHGTSLRVSFLSAPSNPVLIAAYDPEREQD